MISLTLHSCVIQTIRQTESQNQLLLNLNRINVFESLWIYGSLIKFPSRGKTPLHRMDSNFIFFRKRVFGGCVGLFSGKSFHPELRVHEYLERAKQRMVKGLWILIRMDYMPDSKYKMPKLGWRLDFAVNGLYHIVSPSFGYEFGQSCG